MASSYSSEEVDFYKELDDFELQLPGRGKDSVPFSANQVLLEMLQEMYPDWEEEGKVTSVPVARIPQQFLHNRAMCKKLEERLKSTQKGELGEQKLYRLFAHGNFDDQPGVIIFPNLNCSHLFRTQVAKVEIDLLLVHQRKGVFIFNVKTVGGKCSSEELRMDILKQRRLIELLIDYKPDKNQGQNDVPIHSIICNFLDDSKKFKCLEEKTDNVTLVFNKIDLDPAKFPKFWADKINDDEIKSSIKSESALKVLVARLVALSSIKKSAAAIHQNMKSGFLQAYAQPTPLETQISAFKSDKTFEDLVMKLSETVNQNGKKKFILWTKEQMDTIAQIYDKLMNPVSENGMRVLVEGCKGSGKTLLLIFITKLAQRIFRGRNENGHGRIMVFVGCRREGVLIEQLRAAFIEEWREIVIRDNPYLEDEYSTFYGASEEGGLQSFFMEDFRAAKLLLCDEFVYDMRLVRHIRDDQHCVLFTSTKCNSQSLQSYFANSKWDSFQLSFSLRSTGAIANFANNWVNRDELIDTNFPCRPSQNFEGEPNDIVFAKSCDFVPTSARLISLYIERTSGLQTLPVICFMSRETRSEVLTAIIRKSMNCDTEEFGVTEPRPGKPLVKLFEPDELEGSEFSSVIILISFNHINEIGRQIYPKFLTAISRATSKTAIIINQDQLSECRESENVIGSCCAFDVYQKYVEEIRTESDAKIRYLLIGPKELSLNDFVQSDQLTPIPEIPSIILYVAKKGNASFLYCQDVYKESHLDKLYEWGIRKIVILGDSFCWPFYQHTIWMIMLYSEKRNIAFNIRCPDASTRESAGNVISVLEYCRKLCKRSPALSTLREKWAIKEVEPPIKHFTWSQWKEKAMEAYKVQKIFLAFRLYTVTLNILQDEYNVLLQDGKILAAQKNGIERAKLLTNCALISINATKVAVDWNEDVHRKFLFCNQNVSPYESPFSLIRAVQFSLKALKINAYWIRSYERLKKVIEELKQYFESEQKKMEPVYTDETSSDVAIKELISRDKKKKCIFVLWESKCDYHPAASTIEKEISKYERLLNSGKERELIELRKTISSLLQKLSEENLGQADIGIASIETLSDLLRNVTHTIEPFYYSVRLAIEAWKWNPVEPKSYQVISTALRHLEDVVTDLRQIVNNVVANKFLEELVRREMIENNSSSRAN